MIHVLLIERDIREAREYINEYIIDNILTVEGKGYGAIPDYYLRYPRYVNTVKLLGIYLECIKHWGRIGRDNVEYMLLQMGKKLGDDKH